MGNIQNFRIKCCRGRRSHEIEKIMSSWYHVNEQRERTYVEGEKISHFYYSQTFLYQEDTKYSMYTRW